MSKCEWGDCRNFATKVLSRNATEEEISQSEVITKEGASWIGMVETSVCEDHLAEAQQEYPAIVS
jgi:hypothetical protein